uniref:SH3 domain-containing protein n=1 Tax=Callorhinchus milii TaxID=7868 RepID=A0A4W3GET0_CALMI
TDYYYYIDFFFPLCISFQARARAETFPRPQSAATVIRNAFQATAKCVPIVRPVKPEQAAGEPTVQVVPRVSCPTGSDRRGPAQGQVEHRKTGSWDSCYQCISPSRPHSSATAESPKASQTHAMCFNRCRVVFPYPAQGEAELDLQEGDILLVHRKHQDGWFQGTHKESGKSGLFPGSFVENLQ